MKTISIDEARASAFIDTDWIAKSNARFRRIMEEQPGWLWMPPARTPWYAEYDSRG